MFQKPNKNTKLFLSYVLPSMIGMLIVGSYSIIDTIFIGRSSGEFGLASVAVTWPLVMLFGAIGDMFGTGAAIIIAQSRGSGNTKHARRIFGNMLYLQILFSLGLMAGIYFNLPEILVLFGAKPELMPGAVSYSTILIFGSPAFVLVYLAAVVRLRRCLALNAALPRDFVCLRLLPLVRPSPQKIATALSRSNIGTNYG